jgi:hypothetical protein
MRLAGIEVSDNQTRINGMMAYLFFDLYSVSVYILIVFICEGLAVSRSLGNHFVKEQNIGMIAIPYLVLVLFVSRKYFYRLDMLENA